MTNLFLRGRMIVRLSAVLWAFELATPVLGQSPSTAVMVDPSTAKAAKISSVPPSTNSANAYSSNDVRLLSSGNQQAEVHVTINPTNSSFLIASANTLLPGPAINQGYYQTTNSGFSWGGSDQFPNPNGFTIRGDPSTAVDATGRMFIATMVNNPTATQYGVVRSTDNGGTWTNLTAAVSPETDYDKDMIAVDTKASSPYVNNFYGTWTNFSGDENNGQVRLNRSTDNGTTFSTPVTLRFGGTNSWGQGANVQTGPNGEVYVCWADYTSGIPANGIGFARSTDGGVTFSPATVAFPYSGIRVAGTDPNFNNIRVNDFPAMAVDLSSGAHQGRIYIVYPEKENGNGRSVIQERHSDDSGNTWSAARTVSVDARQSWFPWVAVDNETGDVSIIYYALVGTSGFSTHTYVAHISDNCPYFENIQISDVAHTTAPIPGYAGGYAGDYIGIAAKGGRVYPVWSDDRSGTWQIYSSPFNYHAAPYIDDVTVDGTPTSGPFAANSGSTHCVHAMASNGPATYSISTSTNSGNITLNLSGVNNGDCEVNVGGTVGNGSVIIQATNACGTSSVQVVFYIPSGYRVAPNPSKDNMTVIFDYSTRIFS